MRRTCTLFLLVFLVSISFGWFKVDECRLGSVTSIDRIQTGGYVLCRPAMYDTTLIFHVFDRNGVLLHSSNCFWDTISTHSGVYAEQVKAMGSKYICCASFMNFGEGQRPGICITDTQLTVISGRELIPTVPCDYPDNIVLQRFGESEMLVMVDYNISEQVFFTYVVLIDTLCTILNEAIIENTSTGYFDQQSGDVCYVHDDSTFTYAMTTVYYTDTTVHLFNGICHASFEGPITEKKLEIRRNMEHPLALKRTADGGYLSIFSHQLSVEPLFDYRFYRLDEHLDTLFSVTVENHHLGNVNNIYELSSGMIAVTGHYSITGFPWAVAFYSPDGDYLETRYLADDTMIDTVQLRNFNHVSVQCENGDYLIAGISKVVTTSGDTINGTAMMRLDSLFNDVPLAPDKVSEAVLVPEELSITLYPNPFNSALAIGAPLGSDITIHDTSGRLVASPGNTWKPEPDTPSGIYLVKATFEGQGIVKKAVYLK